MELWLGNFFGKADKFNLQRVVGKQRNWQWIFPQNVAFFVSATLLGLVKISKRGIGGKIKSISSENDPSPLQSN